MPKVSICMPAFRDSRWLHDAIQSALSQSVQDIEVILTDDSGGSLRSAVASFEDPRIRYFANSVRLGLAGNHCEAISRARGEFVAFLHDDDRWAPQYLRDALETFTDRCVGVAITQAMELDPDDRELGLRPTHMVPGIQHSPLKGFLTRGELLWLPSLSIFRHEALATNRRPWFDGVTADTTMFIDATLAGWKVSYVPQPNAFYRIHPGQAAQNRLAHRKSMVALWGRYRFDDPELDRLRRSHLAAVLVARAGAYIREGKSIPARHDLIHAKGLDSSRLPGKRRLLWALSYVPSSLVWGIEQFWDRVHDPHRFRHVTDAGA
jgi:glycosyltransferase involved in cell wall biosynthesis